MLRPWSTATALAVVALLLAACGSSGGNSSTAKTPTATPRATKTPKAGATSSPKKKVHGIDVATVGQARDRFVELCKKRAASPSPRLLSELRHVTATLISAFHRNPDQPFRRSPGVPAVTMRARLVSLGVIAHTRCGGGGAVALGKRISKAVATTPKQPASGG